MFPRKKMTTLPPFLFTVFMESAEQGVSKSKVVLSEKD